MCGLVLFFSQKQFYAPPTHPASCRPVVLVPSAAAGERLRARVAPAGAAAGSDRRDVDQQIRASDTGTEASGLRPGRALAVREARGVSRGWLEVGVLKAARAREMGVGVDV